MKLVKENISFIRGEDPKDALGIGQRYLIEKWLEEMKIYYYTINDDMSIDVRGHIQIKEKIIELPEYIKFNYITRDFEILHNENLINLRGAPIKVGEDCLLTENKNLKSFVGAPKHIGQSFYCRKLDINSLEGFPKYIGNTLYLGIQTLKDVSNVEIRKVCKIKGSIKREGY